MPDRHVLLVEDEPGQVEILRSALRGVPVKLHAAASVAAAIEALRRQRFDVVLCDLVMPGGGGMEVLGAVRRLNLPTPVIIVTGYGDEESLAECVTAGAFDFISKPVERLTLRAVLCRALLRSGLICTESPADRVSRPPREFPGLVGTSRAMQEVYERMAKVAAVDATVCLFGESGTGKELVARALHATGPRARRPFVVLDCAAVPEGLMESELFGHVKGAFTSAVSDRPGVFQLADGGTLFLDEVAELPLALQARLLRVLQCREFRPVGGRQAIRVNVRLIAATHQDLRARVQAGEFREDLLYRLDVLPLTLPPLRARKEDIPFLVEHFLTRFNAAHSRQLRGVSARTMTTFLRYDWPGNVRELENCIERAGVLAEQDILDLADLPPLHPSPMTEGSAPGPSWPCTLQEAERALIRQTLLNVQGNRSRAAELLGISLRGLHYKLKELKLTGGLSAPRTGDATLPVRESARGTAMPAAGSGAGRAPAL